MNTTLVTTVLAAVVTVLTVLLWPSVAHAHCDTEDGPAVRDGRIALDSGNINHALKWISADGEPELREAFALALDARRQGGDAATAGDQAFLETLVRIHRAGEGEEFDGIKPTGVQVDPIVRAADAALESGSLDELAALVEEDRIPQLRVLFEEALALRDFDVDDVTAGRAYIAAYVRFFAYAEGEELGHGESGHGESGDVGSGHAESDDVEPGHAGCDHSDSGHAAHHVH